VTIPVVLLLVQSAAAASAPAASAVAAASAPAASAAAAAAVPLASGEKIFMADCAVGYCHGVGGAANRGPRLRGRTFETGYVERTVRRGIPNSAMPAFQGKLNEADLTAVVAYVVSIAAPAAAGTPGTPPAVAPKSAAMPAELATGRSLFQDATREARCAICHQAGGIGQKAGPDVVAAARRGPPALVAVIRASRAKGVRRAVLRSGEAFPARIDSETPQFVRVYDLGGLPPVLRTLRREDIVSLDPDPEWDHGRVAAGYSDAELAEIMRYLAWLAESR